MSSSVKTDLQPFQKAIAVHGLSGSVAGISVCSVPRLSYTDTLNASQRRNELRDVDLNTF
jgi:hypothetical protein